MRRRGFLKGVAAALALAPSVVARTVEATPTDPEPPIGSGYAMKAWLERHPHAVDRCISSRVVPLFPIPSELLVDVEYPLWDEIRPRLEDAMAAEVDRAFDWPPTPTEVVSTRQRFVLGDDGAWA